MKKGVWIFIIFIIFCFSTCRKDGEVIDNTKYEPCIEIPPAPVGFGYNFILDTLRPSYEAPSFNPNNANEIVFRKRIFPLRKK